MITLLIDTSLSDVSIAILKENEVLSNITKKIPNQHSIYTVSFINQCLEASSLKPNDIEQIMVVNGPGSFTGVRIGVTIAKVYAYLLNIPIICLSSLKIRALSIEHQYCLSIIDARHNNYYIGLYDKENQEVIPEQFTNQSQVLDYINKYHPIIVSASPMNLDSIEVEQVSLNFSSIAEYYSNIIPSNPHFVVPNYLKLPQVLEEKHD